MRFSDRDWQYIVAALIFVGLATATLDNLMKINGWGPYAPTPPIEMVIR